MKLLRISASWCTSCIITYKDFKNIISKYNCDFEELDFDMDEEKIKEYNIGNILPVIIVYKDSKEVARIIGEKKEKDISKVLDELV